MDGQITLFEYEALINCKEPPKLLEVEQVVFVVNKGDVERCTVLKSFICGDGGNDRGYCVLKDSGGYDVIHNSKMGQSVFKDEETAKEISEKFLSEHTVIRASDIILRDAVTYSYIRDIDGRKMIAFYCEVGKGMLYMKDFMTFHHIMKNSDKTIKEFMKKIDEMKGYGVEIEQIEYTPVPKNMYLCSGGSWLYTEAGCSYGTG